MAKRMLVAVPLVVFCLGATHAAQFGPSPIEPGRVMTRDVPAPLAPFSITQNLDPNTLVSGLSVACIGETATRDNGWWRVFDLDADFGLTGEVCVESVDYGIEVAVGTQSIELFVGCLPDSAPQPGTGTIDLDFVNQVGSHSQPQPEATLEFFGIDGSGCCDAASESLIIGLLSEDCEETDCGGGPGSCCQQLFIGANDLGETDANYLSAPDCGVDEPVYGPAICFECTGVVMVVHGADEGPDGGVPASTGLGAVLIVLLLLGASAWFLRRRAAD